MSIQQQQGDDERRRAEEDAAWEAHLAYIRNMYASPARGYGPGHYYKAIYSGLNNEHVEQVRK